MENSSLPIIPILALFLAFVFLGYEIYLYIRAYRKNKIPSVPKLNLNQSAINPQEFLNKIENINTNVQNQKQQTFKRKGGSFVYLGIFMILLVISVIVGYWLQNNKLSTASKASLNTTPTSILVNTPSVSPTRTNQTEEQYLAQLSKQPNNSDELNDLTPTEKVDLTSTPKKTTNARLTPGTESLIVNSSLSPTIQASSPTLPATITTVLPSSTPKLVFKEPTTTISLPSPTLKALGGNSSNSLPSPTSRFLAKAFLSPTPELTAVIQLSPTETLLAKNNNTPTPNIGQDKEIPSTGITWISAILLLGSFGLIILGFIL